MKNLKIYTAAILIVASVFLFSACSGGFLEVPPTGAVSQKTLTTPQGINSLLIGAYAALDMQGTSALNIVGASAWATPVDNWTWGSLAGGEAHKGSTSNDQPSLIGLTNMTIGPTNNFLNVEWRALYEGVARANSVINTVDEVKGLSKAEKTNIMAQARFLRGHYYFYLTQMFGKVPWIGPKTEGFKQPNDKLLWPKIVADFKFAYQNLPETQSSIAKANKWAAAAYLGKTYLFMHEYGKAKTILDKVVQSGVTTSGEPYKMLDNFAHSFMAAYDNNSGVVFAVQFTAHDGSGLLSHSRNGDMLNYPYGGPSTCCGFFTPSQDLVNSFRTNAKGLPLTSVQQPFAYDKGNTVTSDRKVAGDVHFTSYQGNLDPRLDWTVGRRGIPFQDFGPDPGQPWTRTEHFDGPYFAIKHIWWKKNQAKFYNSSSWAPGNAINYAILRFAGVLLLDAEANAQTGNLNKARQLVNKVRDRVHDDNYGAGWPSYKLNKPFASAVVKHKSEVTSVEADPGDWVVVTSTKSTYQLLKSPADNINNWNEYKNANYKIGLYPVGSPAFATKKAALHAIHFERKLELATEGHRFFDLARWGTAKKQMDHYYHYEGDVLGYPFQEGATFNKKHVVYPIPQKQIDLSIEKGKPTLTQNEGYQ